MSLRCWPLCCCAGCSPPGRRGHRSNYDPLHTMLALNMAIVSIHRIVTTQDRIVLDQEYQNIINNLKLGSIEADFDITSLYRELLSFVILKTLRQEESERFLNRYDQREKDQLVRSLTGIRAYGGGILSFLGNLVVSCTSVYFGYQDAKNELQEGLDDELWRLKKRRTWRSATTCRRGCWTRHGTCCVSMGCRMNTD